MSTPTLWCISYSPWSRKARWAVEHSGVAHRRRAFTPLIDNPRLRLATRRPFARFTLPCWIEPGLVLMDSFAIARHVDGHGTGTSLFPTGQLEAIEAWNARSEAMLHAGRVLTTASVSRDPQALRDAVPRAFTRLGPVGDVLGRVGVRYLRHKYGFGLDPSEAPTHTATIREGLQALREGLDGGDHLLGGTLTYADLTMGHALDFVAPPDDMPVTATTRPHWTREALATEFADVVGWRDRLFAAHRPSRPRVAPSDPPR